MRSFKLELVIVSVLPIVMTTLYVIARYFGEPGSDLERVRISIAEQAFSLILFSCFMYLFVAVSYVQGKYKK